MTGASLLLASGAHALERGTLDGSSCRALNPAEAGDLQISGSSIENIVRDSRDIICDVAPAYSTRDSILYSVQATAERELAAMGDFFECAIAVASPDARDSTEISSNRLTSAGRLSVDMQTLNRDGDAMIQIKCALPEGTRLDRLEIDQHPLD